MPVVALVLLAGCNLVPRLPFLKHSPTGPTALQLASAAVANYQGAATVGVRGSYAVSGTPVTVKLALQPTAEGSASGSATYKSLPLTYLRAGGQTYMQGTQYWQQAAVSATIHLWPAFGQGWVLTPSDDPAATAIGTLTDLGGLVLLLSQQERLVRASGTTTVAGQRAQRLVDGATTWDVTTTKPYRLLQVAYTGDRPTSGGISHATLQVTYNATPQATPPPAGQFVNPEDLSTLPAYYTTTAVSDLQSCDGNSCGFTVTVQNLQGPALGQTVATLGISKDAQGQSPLGSCQVAVPAIAYNQTTTVTCRVTDPTYRTFYANLNGTASVYKQISYTNPPFPGAHS